MLFSSVTWNNIKTFISGNDMQGFLALPGALVGVVCHFLDRILFRRILIRLHFDAFWWLFAGKIIVSVHLNPPPCHIWTSSTSKAWISRNAFVFLLPKLKLARCLPFWRRNSSLGFYFAKIIKNSQNYPLKMISLAIKKRNNQSEIVLQSGIPMTY